jgi:hypothetical protein
MSAFADGRSRRSRSLGAVVETPPAFAGGSAGFAFLSPKGLEGGIPASRSFPPLAGRVSPRWRAAAGGGRDTMTHPRNTRASLSDLPSLPQRRLDGSGLGDASRLVQADDRPPVWRRLSACGLDRPRTPICSPSPASASRIGGTIPPSETVTRPRETTRPRRERSRFRSPAWVLSAHSPLPGLAGRQRPGVTDRRPHPKRGRDPAGKTRLSANSPSDAVAAGRPKIATHSCGWEFVTVAAGAERLLLLL